MIAPTDLQSVGYCLPADCKSAGAREQGNESLQRICNPLAIVCLQIANLQEQGNKVMIAPTDLQSVGYCLPADCKSAGAR